ncbi:cardiolipin synthase ClsB [Thiobacter aerophilum]|uniref:Cardiolipin synthase B n=1 Tax=Thiobacter aerophilum TaxID=3121275 RepID=A0ABV0EHW6_9BURK
MKRFVAGNRLTLLKNGTAYFPALDAALDAAREHAYLETYIYRDDAAGRRIAAALMRAARRGVATHLMLDGFGSKPLPIALLNEMRAAGVQVLIYRPEASPWRLRRHRLRRLHRKLAVVDGAVGFVGGINILDDADPADGPPQYDYAVAVEGPLVGDILAAMRSLWHRVAFTQLRHLPRRDRAPVPTPEAAGTIRARFLVRDNLRHRRDIERAYLRAIGKAREEILLANAYFLPGTRFRHALLRAAARGVRVVLLVQGTTDHPFVNFAAQALHGRLLEAGVEIHAYTKSMLHAKVAVIDGVWATVGSSNIDPFSLVLSREANVVVYDREFSTALRADMLAEIATGAVRVTMEDWAAVPLWRRLVMWLAYGLARMMMGWVNYAHNDPPPISAGPGSAPKGR